MVNITKIEKKGEINNVSKRQQLFLLEYGKISEGSLWASNILKVCCDTKRFQYFVKKGKIHKS